VIDVVKALQTAEVVEVTTPTKVGVVRGWQVAEHIIREQVPMWLVAAGIEHRLPPASEPPSVGGFADLGPILGWLRSIPLDRALQLDPGTRVAGVVLAQKTQVGPLRAVETALKHACYDPADEHRLCEVQMEVELVMAHLGGLALARHKQTGTGEFDLAPWQSAKDALAERL